jgi:hypothetical protein
MNVFSSLCCRYFVLYVPENSNLPNMNDNSNDHEDVVEGAFDCLLLNRNA